ncbi:MAG: type II toxin-antitoxin system RelE/ParE family toxin [Pirellulales bacterium]|nr:type II toxin-antitoxin system RelE/ParE family toxin [Pirellulales bacterium]
MSAPKTKLLLAERALRDIAEIETYSISQWGKRTASRYIADIEAALERVRQDPELLRPEEDFHPELAFYRVNKHLLVCDVQDTAIFLLTVIHASRDIPSRLAEMEPMLAAEVELLHAKLKKRKKR